jgi:hypothetical protein
MHSLRKTKGTASAVPQTRKRMMASAPGVRSLSRFSRNRIFFPRLFSRGTERVQLRALQAAEKREFLEGDGLQAVHNCFVMNAALWMTAKLMSGSVFFEPISKSALYQGTTSVVPKKASRTRALAPAALLPSQFGFGQRSAAQPARRTLSLQHEIAAEGAAFAPYLTFFRNLFNP